MKRLQTLIALTLFASLLNFFGCSGQTKSDNTHSLTDTLNEQISKSVEDFKNRPIHKILTGAIIDKTPDDQLLQTVFDNLSEKLPQDHTKEYETVLTFTKGQQAIYVIWCLDAEVNNGGFNQFYVNTSGQLAKLIPDALQLVGASKFADLVKRANKVYETEKEKITKNQDGTLEGFSKSYDDNPLNDFDDKFYDLEKVEDLQKLQINFVRRNKTDFIDK
jgi:hypothetical protein